MVSSQARREVVKYFKKEYEISERVACEQANINRSTYRYKGKRRVDKTAIEEILEIAKRYVCYGYRRVYALLRRRGIIINHKKVYRLYKNLNLHHRKVKKKKYSNISSGIQSRALTINELWSMDFMSDRLENGKKLRILNVMDTYSRESLTVSVSATFTSEKVVGKLEELIKDRGVPKEIKLDNGPEYIASTLKDWAKENNIKLNYIPPGKPHKNGHIESFNGKFRKEFLDQNIFRTILEAKVLAREWEDYYNKRRPHSSLGYMTPEEYRNRALGKIYMYVKENLTGETKNVNLNMG